MGFILGAGAAFLGMIASDDEDFRESIPMPIRVTLPILSSLAFSPAISSVLANTASAIGATTATTGFGKILGAVLNSRATAIGLGTVAGSAIAGNKVDLKNVALALLPGAIEGKTFLGTTISPAIARSMAIGGGLSGDYKQALISGITAGMIESSLNSKIGQWIDARARSFGLENVSGLKNALLVGGSVSIYESQRQSLLDMQRAMQAEYDRLYKEEMERARQAELAAMQAEEARINALNAQEEELERQRLEYLAQEQAKMEERKRIEAPLRNKFALRRMRARKMLEELRGTHVGLAARLGELPAAA